MIHLYADAMVALDRLRRYRAGEKMASVWEHFDGYPPDEQRNDDRRLLCNSLIDGILKGEIEHPEVRPYESATKQE